jgi:hypothetical protein
LENKKRTYDPNAPPIQYPQWDYESEIEG